MSEGSAFQSPHLSALFAGLSAAFVFALIELRRSSYIERLDAFVEEQATAADRSDQGLEFPEFLGLGGDRVSMIVAIAGALLAIFAIYLGTRSWTSSQLSKVPLFLARFGVVWGALSLLWIGAISLGFA